MVHILKCHDIANINLVRGENCTLYDEQGKRYVDFESGIWSTVLGHSHPRIVQVMSEQIRQVIHLGPRFPGSLADEAARDVLDITGIDDGKCVFLSSGSEAVEFAVQAARRVTGKRLLLRFTNSYLGAYGSSGRQGTGEWHLVDWDACASADQADCWQEIPFEHIGGFAFEPGGSGLGFVRFPPKQLVQRIVQRVRQEGGLIVANEVTTGMGRTGKWFGFQHYDIQPDIVSLGKGLGGGYPVSAVALKREVAEDLENSGFRYVQSHQNDPLGCSVAREVIAILREEKWVERGSAIGAYFLERLRQLEERHAVVKEARGRGMLLALAFHAPESFSATSAFQSLWEQGFLVGCYPAGNILRFDPALTIEKEDIDHLVDCLDRILEATERW